MLVARTTPKKRSDTRQCMANGEWDEGNMALTHFLFPRFFFSSIPQLHIFSTSRTTRMSYIVVVAIAAADTIDRHDRRYVKGILPSICGTFHFAFQHIVQ